MIKPEQIPEAVVYEVFKGCEWDTEREAAEAIAAALNAWQGMDSIMLPRMVRPGHFVPQNYIRLPLPQENSDA